jgi:hypothetical protein
MMPELLAAVQVRTKIRGLGRDCIRRGEPDADSCLPRESRGKQGDALINILFQRRGNAATQRCLLSQGGFEADPNCQVRFYLS